MTQDTDKGANSVSGPASPCCGKTDGQILNSAGLRWEKLPFGQFWEMWDGEMPIYVCEGGRPPSLRSDPNAALAVAGRILRVPANLCRVTDLLLDVAGSDINVADLIVTILERYDQEIL